MPEAKDKHRRARGTGHPFQKVKGRGLWHIQYYYPNPETGRKECKKDYIGAPTRATAERVLRDLLAKIDRGEQFETGRARTVVELYKALHTTTLANARPGSRKAKGLGWRWKHLGPFFGAMRATAVTTTRIDEYKQNRRGEGAKNATINRELGALRRMFRQGKQSTPPTVHTVPHIPMLDERDNVRVGFVEDDAFDCMVEEAAKEGLWLRALVEVAYTYGWRRGELINLRVRQVNLDLRERTIRLDPGTTKNLEGREVWMNDTICTLLAALCEGKDPDDHVFTRADGKPVKDFRAAWQNLCIRACLPGPDGKPSHFECSKCKAPIAGGTKKCRACGGERRYVGLILHDMRRSAARALRRAGVPESVIMKAGGWKTRSMFERYNITNRRDQQEAMAALDQYRQKQINPRFDPLGVESNRNGDQKETTRLQ